MTVYLCTVGEKTTEVAKAEWERLGFNVVVLDERETWYAKYTRFIRIAKGDCLRADADFIPNSKMMLFAHEAIESKALMAQSRFWDFYRNDIGIGGGVYYRQEGLEIIRNNLGLLDPKRPEATAWRIPDMNPKTHTSNQICGMHGFAQDKETMERAWKHKVERKQIKEYNFKLAFKLAEIAKQ